MMTGSYYTITGLKKTLKYGEKKMNALALVLKFQERLGVSIENAIWRVAGFVFLSVCLVATLTVAVIWFPRATSFTERISLLPELNYIQVEKILDGEIMVSKDQFSEVAKENTVFVSPEAEYIVYMTKVAGVSYRYDQATISYYCHRASSQKIQKGTLIKEMERNTWRMLVSYGVVIVFSFFFLWNMFLIQSRRASGFGDKAIYREVWW